MRRVCLLLPLLFCLCSPAVVHAGIGDTGIDTAKGETLSTNPKSRDVAVTAKVVDTIPPTAPILVAPPDATTLTTVVPTFIWQPSTDEQGIGKYQFWLDNSLLFDNIPTGSTTNSQYTLVVEDGELKLTSKTSLAQGPHTWKVVAFDNNGNQTSSATWSFTIDTQAPLTVVTHVGSATVTISSDNPASVPAQAIQLQDNEPAISGTSETGAALRLTVNVPGEADINTTVTDGTFKFQLGVLPVDTVMYFTLTSSDAVGNTSIINQVPFIIPTAVIIIPPLLPSATPLVIPVPRPSEIINQPPEVARPPIIRRLLENVPALVPLIENQITKTIAELLPPITLAAPLLVATAVVVQTGASIFGPLLTLLSRLLQALGLIPTRKPRGVVFNVKTGEPIAFATINIMRSPDYTILETVVSDVEGIYRSIKFPVGTYRLQAIHPDFTFPTKEQPHWLVNPHDFYRGEEFTIKTESEEELFMIPMDPIATTRDTRRQYLLKLILASCRRFIARLFYPMAIFSFALTLFYPTFWNILVCFIYLLMIGYRLYHSGKEPFLRGCVHTHAGTGVANVMVRISEQKTNQLMALLVTDVQGNFKVHLTPGNYALTFTRDGYVLPPELGEFNTLYAVHQAHTPALDVPFDRYQETV